MKKDIEALNSNLVMVDKIGKYDKFTELCNKTPDVNGITLHEFSSTELSVDNLHIASRFCAMERMQENLNALINDELKKNLKLQEKIRKIENKAKERIDKLKEKPTNKLKIKYNYKQIDDYFSSNKL